MNSSTYLKWAELHNNPKARKTMPEILLASWEASQSLGISPEISIPLISPEEDYKNDTEKWKALYFYAHDVLTTTSNNFNDFNFALALFDQSGCLIRLYGDEESLSWLKENDIDNRAIWDEKIIGTNAVSLGLKSQKSVAVIGEQHFSKFAINIAMYFSPIIFEKNTKVNSEYGGIAIIVPVENNNSIFSITADALARTVALHFFWFESVNLFVSSLTGYIILNQSDDKNTIIFINKQLFNLLKLPYKNMYYKSLEEIVDPYPQNREFWNIINNKIKVQDTDMKIYVHGVPIKINFTVRPYYGRNYHLEGVSLIISSQERIQNIISKHAGNNATFTFSQIIGHNEKYLNVLSQAKAAAQSTVNVLLLGESGVGKDIIAQSIHNASDRKDRPFIAVNCASFAKDLISSELFGYEDGAFTGSKKGGNIGKFELANHGTIFLDEIGDMPLDLQAVLLRVLEQKSFMKIGSSTSTNIDVRIIAATNINLKEKIKKGEFREDLYYRLGIIRLVIPPLRDRKDDILMLASQFIEKICTRINKPLVILSEEVDDFFVNYNWPGNIRELKNLLEGVIQIYDTPSITYEQIANYLMDDSMIEKSIPLPIPKDLSTINPLILNETSAVHKFPNIKSSIPNSKECIMEALELNKYNISNTAKYLGISRNTLYRRIKEYNLT